MDLLQEKNNTKVLGGTLSYFNMFPVSDGEKRKRNLKCSHVPMEERKREAFYVQGGSYQRCPVIF
jgi:hypothetical protein